MKSHKYILLVVLLLFGISILQRVIFYNVLYNEKNYTIEPDINTLIMGASHARMTFSDEIIPNSINLGYDSEPMLLSFLKLKVFTESNPQIRNIILSVYPANFAAGAEETLEIPELENCFYLYLSYQDDISLSDMNKYSNLNTDRYISYLLKHKFGIILPNYEELKSLYKKFSFMPYKRDYMGIMGYSPRSETIFGKRFSVEENVNFFIKRHYIAANGGTMYKSDIMENFFYKILDLCSVKGLNVVLVRTPEISWYRNKIPAEMIENYDRIIKSATQRHKNIFYVDYSKYFDKSEENYFWDCQHVTTKGSEIISTIIVYQHLKNLYATN